MTKPKSHETFSDDKVQQEENDTGDREQRETWQRIKNLVLNPATLILIFSMIVIIGLALTKKPMDAVIKVTAGQVNFNLVNKDQSKTGVEFLEGSIKLKSVRFESFAPMQFMISQLINKKSNQVIIENKEIKIEGSSDASLVFRGLEQPISLQSMFVPNGTRFEVLSPETGIQFNFPQEAPAQGNILGLLTVGDSFIIEPSDCVITDFAGEQVYLAEDSNDALKVIASNLSYDIEFEFIPGQGNLLAELDMGKNPEIVLAETLLVKDFNFLQKNWTSETQSTTVRATVELPALNKSEPYQDRYEFNIRPKEATMEELKIKQSDLEVSFKEEFSQIQPVRDKVTGKEPLLSWLEYIYEKFALVVISCFLGLVVAAYKLVKLVYVYFSLVKE